MNRPNSNRTPGRILLPILALSGAVVMTHQKLEAPPESGPSKELIEVTESTRREVSMRDTGMDLNESKLIGDKWTRLDEIKWGPALDEKICLISRDEEMVKWGTLQEDGSCLNPYSQTRLDSDR